MGKMKIYIYIIIYVNIYIYNGGYKWEIIPNISMEIL